MNYNHLTIEERCCIREYYKEGKSFREIAKLVGRNASAISREINRNESFMNCKPAYYPHTAQKKYKLRRSFCHRGMFWNNEVIKYIDEKLLQTWSPEQIANTKSELKMPSFKTIYRWIYEKYLVHGNVKVLMKKGKTRKRLGNGGRFTTGKSKCCFATLAERTTRYYIAIKMPNRNAVTMARTIIEALSELPKEAVKSKFICYAVLFCAVNDRNFHLFS